MFPLEADVTIPAEYILLEHFIDDVDTALEARLADYIRRRQGKDGGWPLFHDGDADVSASVKAYFALKCVGDDPRSVAYAAGARSDPGTGAAPRSATCSPASRWRCSDSCRGGRCRSCRSKSCLLPRWFPIHLDKVSYWSRTVIVPLLVLLDRKPKAANPGNAGIGELFREDPWKRCPPLVKPTGGMLDTVFLAVDRRCGCLPLSARPRSGGAPETGRSTSSWTASTAITASAASFRPWRTRSWRFARWVSRRTIRRYVDALSAIRKLLVAENGETFCQPCQSPVWDTALAAHALMEAGGADNEAAAERASGWLVERADRRRRRETGPIAARNSPPAAGRSSTATTTIPIPTTPRSS